MTRTETALESATRTIRPHGSQALRLLALGAIAGPLLFDLAWIILGFVSNGYTLFDHTFTHYSPVSQPISGLGMGSTAPYMNTAFVVSGLMLVAGVVGVFGSTRANDASEPRRRLCIALFAVSGLGQAMDGVFTLEKILPHTIGFLLAFAIPIIAFPLAGSYFRGIDSWQRFGTYLRLGSPITLVLLVAFFVAFHPTADGAEHGVAGLIQRIGALELQTWFVAMGWLAFRRRDARPGSRTV